MGWYALGYRVVELLGVLPAIVMTSVFPLLSRYLRESRELARRTIDAAADLFVALGVPLAAGGLVVAPQLVRLIGGDDFEGAADTLRILLFAGALAFVSGLFGMALIAGDRQRSALRLALAALALNVPLNFALVPSLGIDAAAAVAVASELLLVVGGGAAGAARAGLAPRLRMLWRAAAAAAAMAGVLAARRRLVARPARCRSAPRSTWPACGRSAASTGACWRLCAREGLGTRPVRRSRWASGWPARRSGRRSWRARSRPSTT